MTTAISTRTAIFVAGDADCDGWTTTFYRVPLPAHIHLGESDHMPRQLWEDTFDGSNYHNHDDLFPATEADANKALAHGSTWGGYRPEWFDHDTFEAFSVKGSDWVS